MMFAALGCGLLLGALGWMSGATLKPTEALAPLEDRLRTLARLKPPAISQVGEAAFQAMATPLFATARETAGAEIQVKLEGVVRAPGRVAALVSANGAPAQWLEVGQRFGGMILQSVSADGAVIDTAQGTRELRLGDGAPPGDAKPAAPDRFPGGFRMPPPPANAPGTAP
jgi:hypothetical protein